MEDSLCIFDAVNQELLIVDVSLENRDLLGFSELRHLVQELVSVAAVGMNMCARSSQQVIDQSRATVACGAENRKR